MAEGHTPGPWKYNLESPNRVTGPEAQTVAATYGGMVGHEEQLANARLIASVPTLFEFVSQRARDGDLEAAAILEAL